MQKGDYKFKKWYLTPLLFFTVGVGITLYLMHAPNYYRLQGKEEVRDEYEQKLESLRQRNDEVTEESKALSLDRDAAIEKAKTAETEKMDVIVQRDSAVARQRRDERRRRNLEYLNETIKKSLDSTIQHNDSLQAENLMLQKQRQDSSQLLVKYRASLALKEYRLSSQTEYISYLALEKVCLQEEATHASVVLQQHFSYRFLFFLTLLIYVLLEVAKRKRWILSQSRKKMKSSSTPELKTLVETSVDLGEKMPIADSKELLSEKVSL